MSYVYSIVAVAAIFSLLTLALNLHFGIAGLVNFGIVAYFAVGSYTYVLLTQLPPSPLDQYKIGLELPPVIGILGGIAAAVIFAAITGWPALRLREEYLALTTFAFAEVLHSIFVNVRELGNGTRGLSNVLPPAYDSIPADNYDLIFMIVMLAVLALAFAAMHRLKRSPFGASMRAIRDDELAAAAIGKPIRSFRLRAFLSGASIAGLAGVLYGWFTTVVTPGLFTADVTFTAFIALVIGGLGSNVGAIVGAFVFFGIEELLRLVPASSETAQLMVSLRLIPFGIVLILMLRFRPQGLVGRWAP
ncbi:MAG TPA: branched-chain amino acid ABC transporter permease [Solirubrobacter sp.]|nr:branched-chain amino acid ABC transporter permease [Solirubrobacter sp.]